MNPPEPIESILSSLNRPLPFSDEAERGVLSCILQEPNRLDRVLNSMPPSLFAHSINREMFTVLVEEWGANRPIDPVSITHRLRNSGKLEAVGGAAAVSELYTFVPIASHFQFYLSTLRTLWTQRSNIEAHARALSGLFAAQEGEVAEAITNARGLLEDAGNMPGKALRSKTLAESAQDVFNEIEGRSKNPGKLPGFTTGFTTIDRKTGGLQPGHVWVFGGEPGDGKSTIMQNCAEAAAEAGAKVRWYPLEMPTSEQAFRLICSQSEIDNADLFRGVLTNGQQQALTNALRRMKQLGVELVEVEDATATDILADIEQSDCDIAVVDYLQLMEDTSARKSDTRETILASISRRQKRLAKRSGKCIITASQLNDYGKLRESRAIGQDADKVLLVQKVKDEKSESGFDDARRNLLADKNRGGARHWALPLRFLGSVFQFREEIQ